MVEGETHLLITGDFCPINRIEKLTLDKSLDSIFNEFLDVFDGNDLNITDLECPLTISQVTRPKYGPYQKAHPATIEILKQCGFKLVTMANNHIMDFGSKGAMDTIELCKAHEIDIVGIGFSREEASKPFEFISRGKRILIFNFADDEFLTTPEGSPFCNPLNIMQVYYDIETAKFQCDYIIVIIHGGNEFYELPSPRIRELYRYIIDLGADAVISHHTHVMSGYEVYRSKPIFYGLGNFLYDWPGKRNSTWNIGYAVSLSLGTDIGFKIIPFKQCDELPAIFHLNEKEELQFNLTLERLNEIIADDNRLKIEYVNYCNRVRPMYDAFIEPYFGRLITYLQQRRILPKLMSRRKRLLLLNLIRCESHREVLLTLLKKYEAYK